MLRDVIDICSNYVRPTSCRVQPAYTAHEDDKLVMFSDHFDTVMFGIARHSGF
jgi:hypothetical protein